MALRKDGVRLITIHVAFWVVYAAFNHFINLVNWKEVFVEDTVGKYIIAAFIFYSNILFILPYSFQKRKYFLFSVLLILLAFISFFIKEYLYKEIFSLWGYPNPPYSQLQSFWMNSWWWFQYTLIAFGYWFAGRLLTKEKEKSKLELERLHLEYAYLRSQINPHFLHNVLNYFYAKSLAGNQQEQLSTGILYLADIMRYIISNTNEEDALGQVSLNKEIKQIENIIGINQLRFDNKLNVDFEKTGDFENVKVIPFVLVTIIENAFKYGVLAEENEPIRIFLKNDTSCNTLSLYVSNKKANITYRDSTNIGLENIRKRLYFAYGNKQTLSIAEDSQNYTVTLSINF